MRILLAADGLSGECTAQQWVGRLRLADDDTLTGIRPASRPEQILLAARETHSDLVAFGSGRGGLLGRVFRGSASERVAREAPCSVAILRTATAPRRILLIIEEPRAARAAVDLLARLPLPRDASIRMLALLPSLKRAMLAAHTSQTWSGVQAMLAESHRAAWGLVLQAEEFFGVTGPRTEVFFVEERTPRHVLGAVEKHQASLIVIGASPDPHRDRSPLGTIAQALVRHAPCPVLVARTQQQPIEERIPAPRLAKVG